MTLHTTPVAKGLEGVVIAQSDISDVNGNIGTLEYRGYPIQELALNALFEEVVYLLCYDRLPNHTELEAFDAKLKQYRTIPPDLISVMKGLPRSSAPMSVLRTTLSALGLFDQDADDNSPDSVLLKAHRLTASMGTLVAAWERIRNGQDPVAPRSDLTLAGNFLYMLNDSEPEPSAVQAINAYLVMLADHGMNTSTFSCRITISTLSDIYSAITGAIGALKGAAHGGANEKAMRQFIEIGTPAKVTTWFESAMANSMRVMGIGHRVYKTGDPRMVIFKQQAEALGKVVGDGKWFEIATKLEDLAMSHPFFIERKLHPNVDYYSAIVLYQSGVPVDQFTPLFAMSRVAGWCAHIMEQWKDNRLIRPDVQYVGKHNLRWIPLDERS